MHSLRFCQRVQQSIAEGPSYRSLMEGATRTVHKQPWTDRCAAAAGDEQRYHSKVAPSHLLNITPTDVPEPYTARSSELTILSFVTRKRYLPAAVSQRPAWKQVRRSCTLPFNTNQPSHNSCTHFKGGLKPYT
jgi:hypothetical protein